MKSRILRSGMLLAAITMTLHADQLYSTWNFVGTCADCPGIGQGTLEVWTPDTPNPAAGPYLFTFHYWSDWIEYTLNNSFFLATVTVDGSKNLDPFFISPGSSVFIDGWGELDVRVNLKGLPRYGHYSYIEMYFNSPGNGTWSTGCFDCPLGPIQADFGSGGTWSVVGSPVPEIDPATASGAVTLLSGLLLAIRGRRAAVSAT